jgi:2-aminoethylphosphonate-pyruvate transaminase
LVLINGDYGKRIAKIAEYLNITVVTLEVAQHQWIAAQTLSDLLAKEADITHAAMAH